MVVVMMVMMVVVVAVVMMVMVVVLVRIWRAEMMEDTTSIVRMTPLGRAPAGRCGGESRCV